MSVAPKTYRLAIRDLFQPELLGAAAEAIMKHGLDVAGDIAKDITGKFAGETIKNMVKKAQSHFTDHSQQWHLALKKATDNGFKTLEIALAGPSFWERTWIGKVTTSATSQAMVDTMRSFFDEALASAPEPLLQKAQQELRQARNRGFLENLQAFSLDELASEDNPMLRFDDPAALIDAEMDLIDDIASEFRRAGYPNLANLLAIKPPHGQHMLAVAVQFHFRSAVMADDRLRNEFHYIKMQRLGDDLSGGFQFIAGLVVSHAAQLEETLEGISRVEIIVTDTNNKMDAVHEQLKEIKAAIFEMDGRLGMTNRPLSPLQQLAMTTAGSPGVDENIRRFEALPEPVRRQQSNLSLAVSRTAWVAGRFEDSRKFARELAASSKNPLKKAEGYHLAYRNSLELGDFNAALDELMEAIRHDRSFQLFDIAKYKPEAIIGSGAFAVAFRCKDQYTDETVVVKTFEPAGLELSAREIFREAKLLKSLRNPNIIELQHCDFFNTGKALKPFLVLELFENSLDLNQFLAQNSRLLKPAELMHIARPIADGMKSAHAGGVLHRDIKPANVLVRMHGDGRWEVKIIDFGLAMRQEKLARSQHSQISARKSLVGSSVAGTPDYAAPEQLDPDRINEIGSHSDVYAFGRLCYAALLGETNPSGRKLRSLPEEWQDLLSDCTEQKITERLKNFDEVLSRLTAMNSPKSQPVVEVQPTPITKVDVAAPPKPEKVEPKPATVKVENLKPAEPVKVAGPLFIGKKAGDRLVLNLNQLEIPFRWCPPGTFMMGSPKYEKGRYDNEEQVNVTLTKGFWMMETPVTQGLWEAVTGSKPAWTKEYGLGPQYPAYSVDWTEATEFAAKLDEKLREKYADLPKDLKIQLPTEAQWEYACRAGSTSRFYFGDDEKLLGDYAWFYKNSGYKTNPVAQKKPNDWGLFDTAGNVWEWCADWYGEKLTGGNDPTGPASGSRRVIRGGSWGSSAASCRSANRNGFDPSNRNVCNGFRLALNPSR